MNRVIKFRGKRLDNGEWAYGFYNIYLLAKADDRGYDELPVIYNDRCPDFGGGSWRNVSKETVGQFTGLTDVNGREIYEGDIVDCDYILYDPWDDGKESLDPMRCVVEYDNFGFIFKKEEDMCYFLNDVKNIKVVGNIFDNPELLKGGAK